MKILFWGATEEVTGSMTFIDIEGQIGIVDAGLSQGREDSNERNFAPLPYPPSSVSEIVITHAHLDHSGYLPRLLKKGFSGKIFCTKATADLIKIILEDSAGLNEGNETTALYNMSDVTKTLKLLHIIEWNKPFNFLGTSAHLVPAGHILGASSLIIEGKKRIVFSGDLGRNDDFLIPPPTPCVSADLVVMESTYGDRVRAGNMQEELTHLLERIKSENRILIIASFAMARGQVLISLIEEIFLKRPDLKIPLFFDSPMMKKVNEVYLKHKHLTLKSHELTSLIHSSESLDFVGQWNWLKKKQGPLVIISSSGMVTGGRIFRELENWQDDFNAILFLPGYQGENTPGRLLKEGGRTIYDMDGVPIVWSGEVVSSEAFSSHADQLELISWVRNAKAEKIFIIHGDEESKTSLKERLEKFSKEVVIPVHGSILEL